MVGDYRGVDIAVTTLIADGIALITHLFRGERDTQTHKRSKRKRASSMRQSLPKGCWREGL